MEPFRARVGPSRARSCAPVFPRAAPAASQPAALQTSLPASKSQSPAQRTAALLCPALALRTGVMKLEGAASLCSSGWLRKTFNLNFLKPIPPGGNVSKPAQRSARWTSRYHRRCTLCVGSRGLLRGSSRACGKPEWLRPSAADFFPSALCRGIDSSGGCGSGSPRPCPTGAAEVQLAVVPPTHS